MKATPDLIRERLAGLGLEHLDIFDDSERHRGHVGAQAGGGHYHIKIKAKSLVGLPRLAAHRAIYQCLADLIPMPIHALQITLL